MLELLPAAPLAVVLVCLRAPTKTKCSADLLDFAVSDQISFNCRQVWVGTYTALAALDLP